MRPVLAALLALAPPVAAQDTVASRTVVPLPAIYYTPETGLAFGAAVGVFSTPPAGADGVTPPTSSGLGVAIFTAKAQLITSLKAELWPDGGRRHILAGVDFQRYPTKYWGLGNAAPDSAEEDFTQVFTSGTFEWTRRTHGALFVGGAIRFRWRNLTETVAGGLFDDPATPGTATGLVAGAGPLVTWDTRDKVSGPTRGSLLQFRADAYPDAPGPGGAFGMVQADLRGYVPLAARHTVAVQGISRVVWGDAPFDQLVPIGGDAVLRGYFEGRFRDRAGVVLQAEYRGFVLGPVGVAFGGGIGQVAPDLGAFSADAFHSAVGGGLRILIDRAAGLALRIDWATATDGSSSGVYFSAGEAF